MNRVLIGPGSEIVFGGRDGGEGHLSVVVGRAFNGKPYIDTYASWNDGDEWRTQDLVVRMSLTEAADFADGILEAVAEAVDKHDAV